MRRYLLAAMVTFTGGALAHAQTLDQQERCAMQAKQRFQLLSEQYVGLSFGERLGSSYQSHYSKTGKCLVLITQNFQNPDFLGLESSTDIVLLVDATERRQYAEFLQQISHPKKGTLPPPLNQPQILICRLSPIPPTSPEIKICKTREEFDVFVAGYLEE